jgi:hypothetical protein
MNSTFVSLASWIGCIVAGHSSAYGQRQRFRLGSFAGLIFLVGIEALGNDQQPTVAEEKAPALVSAASMLSADTQAMFSLPNSKRFLESWGATQLGMLAADAKLKDFWDTQRREIQARFKEAGWQLSLEIEELSDLSSGQTALAWISRTKVAAKPFSIAMIIDVAGRGDQTKEFMTRVDTQLKAANATAKIVENSGKTVVQYTMPKVAGESRILESFYTVSNDQLLAADDMATITELINAQTGDKADSLAKSALYQTVQAKVQIEGEATEIEYFVRPIGFAKLLRSMSAKPSNNQADILKILDNQGFSDLECFSGNIQMASNSFDFFHNGYLIAKKPAQKSVQILDFPNLSKLAAPDWISKETASVLSFSWDIKKAFSKFKGIVDEYVGDGTFETVMEGIRDDPNGPQIDFTKEVLPYVTSEFHVVTEIVKPIGPTSKRSMVILRLNDTQGKLPSVLDRFGKAEPNAKAIDEGGFRVWRIKNDVEEEVVLDFGTKETDKNKAKEEDAEEPLLDQWAIAIMDDYFIFASDAEMIIDTIRNAKKNSGTFVKEADVVRASQMLGSVAGNDGLSFNEMTRNDRAFEMQYELFRQDILPESKSMLATILDRILKPKNSRQGQPQKVKGDKLPQFNTIQHYFTPSGGVVRTEEDGWSFQSFILSK